MVRSEPGIAWMVPALKKLLKKRTIVKTGMWHRSQTAALIKALRKAGLLDEIEPLTPADAGEACSSWINDVHAGEIEHAGQKELRDAVENAAARYTGPEFRVWDRRDPAINISPVVSCSGAKLLWERYEGDDYDIEDSLL
jgi:hypothetical protein